MSSTLADDPTITQTSSVQERSRLLHLARGEHWPCDPCLTGMALDRLEAAMDRIERVLDGVR